MLKVPDGPDRRDFALAFADGKYIINEPNPDNCVVPPGQEEGDVTDPCNQIGDPEDHGYQSINYRSEPFVRRFESNPDQFTVYDSDVHGDPATPIPRAMLGDPVTFRLHKVADKADGLAVSLAAHQWNRLRGVEQSKTTGVDDQISVTKADTIEPTGGAGGLAEQSGDFIYQETRERRKLEAGYWGIFRVREDYDAFSTPMQPLPDVAEQKGFKPETRPGWNVAYGDLTGNWKYDMIVGVPDSRLGGSEAGAVYVFYDVFGRWPITDLLDADAQFISYSAGARVGEAVSIDEGTLSVGTKNREQVYIIDGSDRPEGTFDIETTTKRET